MKPRTRAGGLVAAFVCTGGCAAVLGIHEAVIVDADGGDAGSTTGTDTGPGDGSDSGSDDGGDGDTDACASPPCCPAAMARVPAPDGGAYCVDATEVSNGAYAAFLALGPSTSALPAACWWKNDFTPDAWGTRGADDLPVIGVDWCDARAFCAAARKRLCGKIGGGPTDFPAFKNSQVSQWYGACSRGGTLVFPYGGAYDAGACIGLDHPLSGAPRAVGSTLTCQGGYPGLFDMSGNVGEWEDACSDSDDTASACAASADGGLSCDYCHVRGGTFAEANASLVLRCDNGENNRRNLRLYDVGFRCCAD